MKNFFLSICLLATILIAGCGMITIKEGTYKLDRDTSRNIEGQNPAAQIKVELIEGDKYSITYMDEAGNKTSDSQAISMKGMALVMDANGNGVTDEGEEAEVIAFVAGQMVITQKKDGKTIQTAYKGVE